MFHPSSDQKTRYLTSKQTKSIDQYINKTYPVHKYKTLDQDIMGKNTQNKI